MGDKVIKPRHRLTAAEIASFLAVPLTGRDCEVNTVASLDNVCTNSLTFSKARLTDAMVVSMRNICIITKELPDNTGENAFILVDNPRLAFAKVLAEFFVERKKPGIGQHTVIDPTAKIGKDVVIGNNCTLGRNVEVGDYTEIHNNVILADGVQIGKYCRIKSNTVIGEKGFGFPFAEDGTPVELPHLASVRLADYVEIGALNTVVGGALSDTIIHSHVKTDDHVHIAHNCEIGARTVITACSEISGSVKIGERCWLSPNCSIMNKINIGDDCFIGLGAVVLKDVPSGAVMVGNPAKILRIAPVEL
jgi:UDP-3-O-[3-hydroxymyristoyl] glucosamine N-acyltransferase